MLKSVRTAVLEIGYEEHGPANGVPIVLLHGFPDDVRAYDGAIEPLVGLNCRVLVPYLRGYGPTRFLSAETPRSGQQAALGADLRDFMDAVGVSQAFLAGYDWGGRAACIVSALWPERVRGLVTIGGYNIQHIAAANRPGSAEQELRYWYQWYFHTERGRAGLTQNRRDICILLWKLWSPNWTFSDVQFERTAASFDNPDFVTISLHSYQHRYGTVPGDPAVALIEDRLAAQPAITVPTIVLHGEADGVNPPDQSEGHARHFTNRYERRVIPVAGHFLPNEAPETVVSALRSLMN